jgi:membrane fusion protein
MQLFRQQALDHQSRLHGDIFLVPPLRWQAISWLLFAAIAVAALFLIFGSYSRSINANGIVRPTTGVASVAVPDDGVLSEILVRDGEPVKKGQVIARLSLLQSTGGQSLNEQRKLALTEQAAALNQGRQTANSGNDEQRRKLRETVSDETRQIAAIEAQMAAQKALITSSEEELNRVKDVAQRGFISGRDMQQRRELLISRRQALGELEQSRSAHANALAAAEIELDQLSEHLRAALSDYDGRIAELKRERATLGNTGTFDLVASRDGVLTALRSRQGDSLAKGAIYGRIVPQSSAWQVELQVPTSTIAQIAPGQDVRVTLGAYPVQDYGTLRAVIEHVGSAPVEDTDPYYLVSAKLDPMTERQRDRGVVLRPDLALQARIVLDKRSFLQWLIDPIAAVSAR